MTVFRQEVLEVSKRIINAIINTGYPALKHTLLDVNGLKSDLALYKVRHIAAKLSHEINLAITKLSLSLIHNTIGLGLPMFINATTRQQISIYSIGFY